MGNFDGDLWPNRFLGFIWELYHTLGYKLFF